MAYALSWRDLPTATLAWLIGGLVVAAYGCSAVWYSVAALVSDAVAAETRAVGLALSILMVVLALVLTDRRLGPWRREVGAQMAITVAEDGLEIRTNRGPTSRVPWAAIRKVSLGRRTLALWGPSRAAMAIPRRAFADAAAAIAFRDAVQQRRQVARSVSRAAPRR